jgi:hypothetical protein
MGAQFQYSSKAHALLRKGWKRGYENQQTPLKDPFHVPVGLTTRAKSKNIKEVINGLIQEIWGDSKTGHSKLGPKEDEGVINLIQAIDEGDLA